MITAAEVAVFSNLRAFWQNIYLRAILFTLIVVVIFWLLGKTQQAWASFLIAFLVAYLVNPFLGWLQKRRIPRGVGVFLVMTALVLIGLMVIVLLSSLLLELSALPVALSQAIRHIPDWLESGAPLWLQSMLSNNQEALSSFFDDTLASIFLWLENNVNNIINQIVSGTGVLFSGIFNIFILFVFIAFTVSGYPIIARAIVEFFPERKQAFVKEMGSRLDVAVGGYIRAKVLESSLMFLISSTVLSLLGVPNALALGLVNAMLNPIPYAGPFVATLIESLVALTVSWQLALTVLIVMAIVEQIDGNIIGPILLSKGVDVHPVLILSSVIVGGALFGFWGVLLAIPTTAFLQLLYKDYYQTSDWYRQKEAPA